ncbi:MAG: M48 family metalloprotease [Actinomycetia bacterium]|nr:M48 family metalloprotease [Actinomycetes bacterium]MCP5030540.1 M48 family metalloprotease [Actinomycetes bacterium]
MTLTSSDRDWDLPTPQYHEELRQHLESGEPEMWAWFSETAFPSAEAIAQAELDLLKTSYRIDGGLHGDLVGAATLIAGRMDLDLGITLYQELGVGERNARVLQLGNHVHVVFGGELLELLSYSEQQTVLAHELAHIALWDREDRAYRILDDMVHRMDAEPLAQDAVAETARRLRLHTEVWADAVARAITDDPNASISSIVKVNAGLRNVDPEAYLRQAQQVLAADPSASQGWTHPELHVRVACLAARDSATPDETIRTLVEGPDDLDRLDLLGQTRLQELAKRMLASATRIAPERSDRANAKAYCDSYRTLTPLSPDVSPPVTGDAANPLDDGELGQAEPSVRFFCAALLVDQALLGDGAEAGLSETRPYSVEAERLGIHGEFDKILGRATSRSASELRRLRAEV